MNDAEWERVGNLAKEMGVARSYLVRRALELADEQKARLKKEPVPDLYRFRG
jgi:hypothetical protein